MRATLKTSDPNGEDGWFVEWVKILVGSRELTCIVNGWMDNGRGAAGPGARTVDCKELHNTGNQCLIRPYYQNIFRILDKYKG